jgi:tape measure domain-containing protein
MMLVDNSKARKGFNTLAKIVKQASLGIASTIAGVFLNIAFAKKISRNLRHAMQRAMKDQRYRIELASLSGIGNQLFNELRSLSKRSPFSIDEWVGGSKRLLSSGVAASKVAKTMEMLGNMSAATGSTVRDLALIYGQVFAKGRLQGEEVLQFMERGISLNKALQKTLGKSARELQVMQEKGLITPEMMDDAMKFMTGPEGIFGGMMDALLMTAEGMLIALRNIWDATMADFGKTILPIMTLLIKSLAMISMQGGVITGFMDAMAVAAHAILVPLTFIMGAFGLLQMVTNGIFGYIVGSAAALVMISVTVVFVKNQTWLLGVFTKIWLKALVKVKAVYKTIAALSATTLGKIKLVAGILLLVGALWLVSKAIKVAVDGMADKFNKSRTAAEKMKQVMDDMNKPGGSGALFGTRQEAELTIRGAHIGVFQEQLAELRKIKAAVEKQEFEKEQERIKAWNAKNIDQIGLGGQPGQGPSGFQFNPLLGR